MQRARGGVRGKMMAKMEEKGTAKKEVNLLKGNEKTRFEDILRHNLSQII